MDTYPQDIQQLLQEHCKYQDADSISVAACKVTSMDITEQNREDLEKELATMEELYSKLNHVRQVYEKELGTLGDKQRSLLMELIQKVPAGTTEVEFANFSERQKLFINRYQRHSEACKAQAQVVRTDYGPQAQVLKALVASYNAEQLSEILEMPVEVAEQVKKYSNSKRPAQVAPAPMDPREPAQIIEDIHGQLEGIDPKVRELHQQVAYLFPYLLNMVDKFITNLGTRLEWLEEAKQLGQGTDDATQPFTYKNIKNICIISMRL